jgi:8-oxo-dGTP diphosphatase
MGANAEILLVRDDGALILQWRDDKPGITNPGHVTSFGGKIEPGETPLQAAWREINEETNLNLPIERLKFWRKYQKTMAKHGEDWTVYYHIVTNVSDTGLVVHEGQGYKIVKSLAEARQRKLSILMQEVVEDYFTSVSRV